MKRSILLSLAVMGCVTTPSGEPVSTVTVVTGGGERCIPPGLRTPMTQAPPDDLLSPPPDAQTSPSGLVRRLLAPGCGTQRPGSFSVVRVHYTGWTTDGRMFDSSLERPEPTQLSLGAVIPGWREALRQMRVGERQRLWIPEELAYKGQSGPQGQLVFDVELVELVEQ